MELAERLKFMTNYTAVTLTGDMVRRLLIVMVVTELKEDEIYQKLSTDCEKLLKKLENDPLTEFIRPGTVLLNRYKELNDGISVEEI